MKDRKKLVQSGYSAVPPGVTAEEMAAIPKPDQSNPELPPSELPQTEPAKPDHLQKAERIRARLKDRSFLQASLQVTAPKHGGPNLAIGEDVHESQLYLPVLSVLPYDKNPRKATHEKYLEIKESIRQRGIDHMPNVTKRPGSTQYMIAGGGNTRLKAQQELWLETQEPRFEFIRVNYRKWVNETKTFAAHIIENEQRADVVFWDKAVAYQELRRLWEEEHGVLTNRRFEELLGEEGLPRSKTILHLYTYSVNRLSALGQACYGLSKNNVRDTIQPRLNLGLRLAQRFQISDEDYYSLISTALEEYAQNLRGEMLDPSDLCAACEQKLLSKIPITKEQLAITYKTMQDFPHLHDAELLEQITRSATAPALAAITNSEKGQESPDYDHQPADAQVGNQTTQSATSAPAEQTPESAIKAHKPSDASSVTAAANTSTLTIHSQRWRENLQQYARLAQIDDLLQIDDTLLNGFYVNAPIRPLNANGSFGDVETNQYVGWWMLAVLSGQLSPTFHLDLPEDSEWRRLQESEDEGEFAATVDTLLGGGPPLSAIGQFLTGGSPLLLDLIASIRERPKAPPRYATILGPALMEQIKGQFPIAAADVSTPEQSRTLQTLGYSLDSDQWVCVGFEVCEN